MRLISTLIFLASYLTLASQTVMDSCFSFQSDPCKKFSLYIPSNYNPAEANRLMLGLHPLNTARWNAESWRDTLIIFAEENQLILACPDGGFDGRIDDAIDTAFTSILLDSIEQWYNIDPDQKYIMGFSWGGKTTYTYGLRRTNEFQGYLVIGAAINIAEVNPIISAANKELFYLVHGSNDNPNIRYTPLLNALEANDACVESRLLQGVGHTIDFQNRNQILTEAFEWLSNTSCGSSNLLDIEENNLNVYPNPSTGTIYCEKLAEYTVQVFDVNGRLLNIETAENHLILKDNYTGIINIVFTAPGSSYSKKILISK